MYSQLDMFQPIFRGLNKVIKEAIPRFVNEPFKKGILLLIDHLYKKTSLAAPEKKLDYCTDSKLAHIPTVA
jgi:hypothetical protein